MTKTAVNKRDIPWVLRIKGYFQSLSVNNVEGRKMEREENGEGRKSELIIMVWYAILAK